MFPAMAMYLSVPIQFSAHKHFPGGFLKRMIFEHHGVESKANLGSHDLL
jgi:hypothetical protein